MPAKKPTLCGPTPVGHLSSSTLAARRSSVRKLAAMGEESSLATSNEKRAYAVSCVKTITAGAPVPKDVAFAFQYCQEQPHGHAGASKDVCPAHDSSFGKGSVSLSSARFRSFVPHKTALVRCLACNVTCEPENWLCLVYAPASWTPLCRDCNSIYRKQAS